MSVENQVTIARLRLRSALDRSVVHHAQQVTLGFALLRRKLLRRMRRDMIIGDPRRGR